MSSIFTVAAPSLDAGGDDMFDASRYAFFGKQIVEDVELGGLEEDYNEESAAIRSVDDRESWFSSADGDLIENLGSLSDIDDLGSIFSKLNRTVSGPRHTGVIGDRRSISRESSLTANCTQETEILNWLDVDLLDTDGTQEGKRWSSQPHPPHLTDPKPLHRTSSYPQEPQHQLSDPLLTSGSSLPPYSRSVNLTRHASIPSFAAGQPLFSPTVSSLSSSLSGPPHGHTYAEMMPPPNLLIGRQSQNSCLDHALSFPLSQSNQFQRQSPYSSNIMASIIYQQHQATPQIHPSFPPYAHLQSYLPYSRPQLTGKVDSRFYEPRDQSYKSSHRSKQKDCHSPSSDLTGQMSDNLPQFRSKYMSAEEIHGVLKMQKSGSHSNDPYIDDYYHQACVAKKCADPRLKLQFRPSLIKDLSLRPRGNEAHSYVQTDTFGKVPLSSICRFNPLLELAKSGSLADSSGEKRTVKPLEKEPMLAARIVVEEGFSILIDIDDIDRMLRSDHSQDGGFQLERRRQVLLEAFAASLQIVDPFGPVNPGTTPKDDTGFLLIASLPKGRKLLSRYLQLLDPNTQLARIVCMVFFQHLRFVFGGLPSDPCAAETTVNLARTVSSCVNSMELSALGACLAAVVCSSEQPPLRPLRSPAGDGASVIIKSVLDRATALLSDRHTAKNYNVTNRTLWQAAFDTFFSLLTRYCLGKYDSIMQMLSVHSPIPTYCESEVAAIIRKEMPVELLRASLPHTNEHQRKVLLDFAQKSSPANSF